MKFKYYCLLAKKSFFNKKTNIINIFLLVLSMLMMVLISSFSKSFNNLITNQVNNNINYHILLIHGLKDTQLLSDVDNILYITDYTSFSYYTKTDKNKEIHLIGAPDSYIKTILRKQLNINGNSIICPIKFYLGDNPEEYDKDYLSNIIDGTKLLNKTISLSSSNYKKNFNIIGVYNQDYYTYGEYNICFTEITNIEEFYNKDLEKIKSECDPKYQDCDDIGKNSTKLAVVKDVSKIDKTLDAIQSMGYSTNKLVDIDTTGINLITTVFIILSSIILVINFIILVVVNNKFLQYDKKNNLIYKSLGYSNNILIKVNYLEKIILTITSFFISILLEIIIYIILNIVFSSNIETGFSICISYLSIIYSFVVVLLSSMLSVYVSISKNKNSIIKELSDEEI